MVRNYFEIDRRTLLQTASLVASVPVGAKGMEELDGGAAAAAVGGAAAADDPKPVAAVDVVFAYGGSVASPTPPQADGTGDASHAGADADGVNGHQRYGEYGYGGVVP